MKVRTLNHLLALCAIVLTISMVIYPEQAYTAAIRGLKLWWDIVFPALLPFFIGSEILMGLGVVHGMGVLLEPLMRPLFNVPGAGSFVMAMGLASGYPIGSVLTSKLRRAKMCSKHEAERLVSFTNTADPLFMSGAVAVGMFRLPEVAPVIMISHYLSSLSVGLLLRFYAPRGEIVDSSAGRKGFILSRAVAEMSRAREKDGRPIGQLLGDAVRNSMNTQFLIGGCIILFSVVIRVLDIMGAVAVISRLFSLLLSPFGIHPNLIPAMVGGMFEITIGTEMAATAQAVLNQRVVMASAIIAWSGLSVHAQVASIKQGTDISMGPYVISRLVHAVLAALYTAILMGPVSPVINVLTRPVRTTIEAMSVLTWIERLGFSLMSFGYGVGALIIAGMLTAVFRKGKVIIIRR